MNRREFATRRRRLMDMMGQGSVAIVPTAPVRPRNRDVDFPYRPDSNFYYLTGFGEPDAVAVLAPGREQGEFVMFCRERDPAAEQWHGSRLGLEGACERHGADDAFPIGDVDDILPGLLEGKSRVYYAMGHYPEFDRRMLAWVAKVRGGARASGGLGEFVMLDHLVPRDAPVQEQGGDPRDVEGGGGERRRARAGHARVQAGHVRVPDRGGAAPRVHPRGVSGARVSVDRGRRRERMHAALHRQRRSIAGPGPAAHRRRRRARLLRLRHHPHVPRQRTILPRSARPVLGGAGGAGGGHRHGGARAHRRRRAHGGGAGAGRRARRPRRAQGPGKAPRRQGEVQALYMHRTGHWLGMDVHDVGDYRIEDQSGCWSPAWS